MLSLPLAFGHLDRVGIFAVGLEDACDLVSGPCRDRRFHFRIPLLMDVE
jgi:hypothetical protein